MSMAETKKACAEHCAYCFDMLIEELTDVQTDFDWSSLPLAHSKMPVFVTWYKRSSRGKHDDLRGCLGTFSKDLPIALGLKKYAVMSAVNDKRFNAISVEEVGSLKVQISLLHSFTRCKDWDDWDVGTHGITIQFEAPHSISSTKYNATYLPDVAPQQRWNKLTTIDHLVVKAGFQGTAASVHKLTVTKYQSCKHTMSWLDFLTFSKSHRRLIARVAALRSVTTGPVHAALTQSDPLFAMHCDSDPDDDGVLNGDGNKALHHRSSGRSKGKGKATGCNGLYPRGHHSNHHHRERSCLVL